MRRSVEHGPRRDKSRQRFFRIFSIACSAYRRFSELVIDAGLSGDPEQDYFAQALTADLTTDLSHFLFTSFVIAHSTALTYKGQAVDPKQLGRELGVRYAL